MKKQKYFVVEIKNNPIYTDKTIYKIGRKSLFSKIKFLKVKDASLYPIGFLNSDDPSKFEFITFNKDYAFTVVDWINEDKKHKIFWNYCTDKSKDNPSPVSGNYVFALFSHYGDYFIKYYNMNIDHKKLLDNQYTLKILN